MLNKEKKTKQNLQKRFLAKRVKGISSHFIMKERTFITLLPLYSLPEWTQKMGGRQLRAEPTKNWGLSRKRIGVNLGNHLKPELWGLWKSILPICGDYMTNLIGLNLYFLGLLRIALPLCMLSLSFSFSILCWIIWVNISKGKTTLERKPMNDEANMHMHAYVLAFT